ncbi:5-(carboxyamino)imidazole ribonucleotide synthase [Limosilactobacillus reuteri]|uniref:5-(carboxyamino)imidazole ribonucleotide synthase n=1 Tax=Limosilactobacillus reuteri TaxID=1598 RepID=UPI001E408017|nr:5-(carboxyamino)imidazole ribonucleotide synthase [Limosilactobacillus reuteri]MCC4348545.1 5-(carboxyamino)imidazole ribonucleotide synthase [Limosilactobacillus reuteri]MCC4374594.1 5-(carboxyamino)imidazole ribonucleotide synthase [Limosilactobacillus reuteri]MCC4386623.1 5-(carboxyamino)imidazole ribonucleotide synthase [Limosilactobacillus reuteri]MDK8117062.1 5-(carboxyamino)imidazole ribonucleotide synthase [Limosilactobacillus reuteri]MDY3299172.1 5-(carboxyamino)imidazole ribonucle
MIKQKKVGSILNKFIPQGSTIGIIGGGQLGQMMALDAKQTGMKVIILDPTPHCPAGQVADEQIVAPYADTKAIEKLADKADVLTYEFENVDLNALEDVQDRVYLPQGTNLLYTTKNRLREKNFLRQAGVKTAPFMAVHTSAELKDAVKKIGYPAVLKTSEGGYDGHGQEVLRNKDDLDKCAPILATGDCILEGWVPFSRECSVMVGRNEDGEITVFPVSENIHHDEILHLSIVPARISSELQQKAQKIAVQIAQAINLRGILGVEMFVTDNGEIYINELAPRPHNSGHYSIEACNFSQFAIHNRAICNWPLPQVELLKPVIMVNVLGQHVDGVRQQIQKKADWHFHDYGKAEVRHNRKMGHVTILTDDIEATLAEIDNTGIWSA